MRNSLCRASPGPCSFSCHGSCSVAHHQSTSPSELQVLRFQPMQIRESTLRCKSKEGMRKSKTFSNPTITCSHQYGATPVTLTDITIGTVTPRLPKDTLKRLGLQNMAHWLLQEMISRSQASPAQIQPELSSATALINPVNVEFVRPYHAVCNIPI